MAQETENQKIVKVNNESGYKLHPEYGLLINSGNDYWIRRDPLKEGDRNPQASKQFRRISYINKYGESCDSWFHYDEP